MAIYLLVGGVSHIREELFVIYILLGGVSRIRDAVINFSAR